MVPFRPEIQESVGDLPGGLAGPCVPQSRGVVVVEPPTPLNGAGGEYPATAGCLI